MTRKQNTLGVIEILLPEMPEYQADSQFLRRELGLVGKKVNHESSSPLPQNSVIYCNNISHWEKRLLLSTPKSVIAIIACNEYYDKQIFEKINNFRSLKCAFIEYLPAQNQIKLSPLVMFVTKNPKVLVQRRFWGTLKLGFKNWLDCKNLKFQIPVFGFPLGYSERFIKELDALDVITDSEMSLLEVRPPVDFGKRKIFTFFGQRGSWYRRFMIDYFQRKFGNFETYSGFGGNPGNYQGSSYATELISSKFVLNPPGNRSSQCARYLETIICGGIPVITEISIQCWINHEYWPAGTPWKNFEFRKLWESLCSLDDLSAEQLNQDLRNFVRKNFNLTRERIAEAISGPNGEVL
jgi:hypothetical protein